MDPIKNPYSPGAGSPPPELVGRDPVLDQARILLGRVKKKRAEKSMMLTGLRGVGKTVLLNETSQIGTHDSVSDSKGRPGDVFPTREAAIRESALLPASYAGDVKTGPPRVS